MALRVTLGGKPVVHAKLTYIHVIDILVGLRMSVILGIYCNGLSGARTSRL